MWKRFPQMYLKNGSIYVALYLLTSAVEKESTITLFSIIMLETGNCYR